MDTQDDTYMDFKTKSQSNKYVTKICEGRWLFNNLVE
jgi:hypothetical protein